MDSYRDCILSQRFSPEIGGSITWLKEVYSRWPKSITAYTHLYPDEVNIEQQGSIKIHRENILMSDWGLDSLDSISKYFRMLISIKNELAKSSTPLRVHCTHLVPEVFSLLPLKLFNPKKLKIVSYAHGEEILACKSSRQLNLFFKLSLKFSDLIIANSKNTANLLKEFGQANITVIHPGVDFNKYSTLESRRTSSKNKFSIKENDFVLLSVGRLCKRKNQASVIDAVSKLKDKLPIKYFLLGSGEEEENLKKKVQALDLQDKVFFENGEEELKLNLLSIADCFIMPSIQSGQDIEGFGISFIEAHAAGLPSISGNIGGQPEAVLNQKTGLVLDGRNQNEIENAIYKLATDKELRKQLGLQAKEHAKSLDWSKVVEQTAKALTSSL